MKTFSTLFVSLCLLLVTGSVQAQNVRVLPQNIRLANADDDQRITVAPDYIFGINQSPLIFPFRDFDLNTERLRFRIFDGDFQTTETLSYYGADTAHVAGPLDVNGRGDIYREDPMPANGAVLNVNYNFADPQNFFSKAIFANNSFVDGVGAAIEGFGGRDGVVGLSSSNGSAAYRGVAGFSQTFNGPHSGGLNTGTSGVATGNETNYGIYGEASGGSINYAGYFEGDVEVTGNFFNGSDKKLKQNIEDYSGALQQVMNLQPKTYDFKTDKYASMNLPATPQIGFLAQDIQKEFPHLVKEAVHVKYDRKTRQELERERYLSVNYIQLIPVLTKAIQEQQTTIEEQQAQIDQLTTLVNQLLTQQDGETNSENNTYSLSMDDGAKLSQNSPNPFQQNTVIDFFIPETVQDAKIRVTNAEGKVVGLVDITTKGEGQLNLDRKSYASGTYFYSLILDGKIIDTKQMVLTR